MRHSHKALSVHLSFLLTWAFLALHPLSGQVIITGKVTDEAARPLADIHVMISLPGSGGILGFDITSDKGSFRISVPCTGDSLVLKTSSVNYSTFVRKIPCRNLELSLQLKPEVKDLEGITVKAGRVIQKGDTLSYLVQPYARSHDQTISDVIRRIPGLEVEPSGRILYEGTAISGVYVEGMNLMENRYALLTQNLPHDRVATVEVITGHEPIKLLREYASPGKVALNLKLKKDITLTGKAEVEGGLPWIKYGVNLTPILFLPKVQSLFSLQANNTGKLLSEAQSMPIFTDDKPDSPDPLPAPAPRSFPPTVLEPASYLNNHSHLASGNVLARLNDAWELRTTFLFTGDRTDEDWLQRLQYFLPDDTLSFLEINRFQHNLNQEAADVSIKHNDYAYYAENKVSLSWTRERKQGNHVRNDLDNLETFQEKLRQYAWNGKWILPLGGKLVEAATFVDYQKMPDVWLKTVPGQVYTGIGSDSVAQNFSAHRLAAGIYGSLYARAGIFKLRVRSGVSYQRLQVNSTLHFFEEGSDLTGTDTNYLNHNWQSRARVYFWPEFTYQTQKTTFTLALPFHSLCLKEHFLSSFRDTDAAYVFAEPVISFYRKWVPFFTLSTSLRRSYQIYEPTGLFTGFILSSPDYLIRNIPLTKNRLMPVTTGALSLKYSNVSTGISAYITASHSLQELQYLRTDSIGREGAHIYDFIQHENLRRLSFLKFSASQSVPDFHLNFSFALSAQDIRSRVLINGNFADTRTDVFELNPSVYFYFSIVDIVYSLRWQKLSSAMTPSLETPAVRLDRHEVSVKGVVNPQMSFSLNLIYNDLGNNHEWITDAMFRYKIVAIRRFKAETGIKLSNLLNASTFTFSNLSAYTASMLEIPLMPAQALVFLRFNY